jgi:ATP phosphoribosyltransferase
MWILASRKSNSNASGQDMLIENESKVDQLLELGFGKCDLCLQVPISSGYTSAKELVGKRITTSFETVTKRFFQATESGKSLAGIKTELLEPRSFEGSLETKVTYVGGSVEAACALGLSDAIVDLVESGETMRAAKLMKIETLLSSQAVLISNAQKHTSNPLIETIKRRIEGVIVAQKYVICTYNILRSSLDKAKETTPGKKAPTGNIN